MTLQQSSKILCTTDGGVSWVDQDPKINGFYFLGVSAVDSDHVWIAGANWAAESSQKKGVIVHSSDGGTVWTVQTPEVDATYSKVSFVR